MKVTELEGVQWLNLFQIVVCNFRGYFITVHGFSRGPPFCAQEHYSLTYGHFLEKTTASPASTLTPQLRGNQINLVYSTQHFWTKKECKIHSTSQVGDRLYKGLCYSLNVYSFHLLIRGIYPSFKRLFEI